MKALILAAGQGTRFQPYTNTIPKPSIPFLGLPMFYYSLFQLHSMGAKNLVYNTYHLADKMKLDFENQEVKSKFETIEESNEVQFQSPLNSGGGLHFARHLLKNEKHFIICNGDEIIIPESTLEFKKYLNFFTKLKPLSLLLTTDHPEAGKKFGAIWVDETNKVYGFGKTNPASSNNSIPKLRPLHFLGTQILSNEIFDFTAEANEIKSDSNILYDVLSLAIKKNKPVFAYNINCSWEETGNLKDYLIATYKALNLLTSKNNYLVDFFNFWKTNSLKYFPNDAILENKFGNFILINQLPEKIIFKHESSTLHKDAVVEGFLVLNKNSEIFQNSNIKNSVVNTTQQISKNLNETLVL